MKKHKFNWVDGLVIVVVLLLVAGTCLKFLVMDTTAVGRETVPFTYQVQISGVRQYTVDAIAVGDSLYEKEGKGYVGVIEHVTAEPALSLALYPDGTAKDVPVEGRFDVTVTVTAEGTPDRGVYKVGTYGIRVGHATSYFTKYSEWEGTVVSLAETEQ